MAISLGGMKSYSLAEPRKDVSAGMLVKEVGLNPGDFLES